MKELEGNNALPVHLGTEIVAKKKVEYKFIGFERRPYKNARLFALDIDSKDGRVYEIIIENKKSVAVKEFNQKMKKDKIIAIHKATVNPRHPMVWALNINVAVKKFRKAIKKASKK